MRINIRGDRCRRTFQWHWFFWSVVLYIMGTLIIRVTILLIIMIVTMLTVIVVWINGRRDDCWRMGYCYIFSADRSSMTNGVSFRTCGDGCRRLDMAWAVSNRLTLGASANTAAFCRWCNRCCSVVVYCGGGWNMLLGVTVETHLRRTKSQSMGCFITGRSYWNFLPVILGTVLIIVFIITNQNLFQKTTVVLVYHRMNNVCGNFHFFGFRLDTCISWRDRNY